MCLADDVQFARAIYKDATTHAAEVAGVIDELIILCGMHIHSANEDNVTVLTQISHTIFQGDIIS